MQWGGIMKPKLKKYTMTTWPVMIRKADVEAVDEQEAWDIFMGEKEGKIVWDDIGTLQFADVNDYIDPELEEVKEG